jgi:hypothetical protein
VSAPEPVEVFNPPSYETWASTARQAEREHARVTEVGLRAMHAELVEQRSPDRVIAARLHAAAREVEATEPEVGQ